MLKTESVTGLSKIEKKSSCSNIILKSAVINNFCKLTCPSLNLWSCSCRLVTVAVFCACVLKVLFISHVGIFFHIPCLYTNTIFYACGSALLSLCFWCRNNLVMANMSLPCHWRCSNMGYVMWISLLSPMSSTLSFRILYCNYFF